MRSLRTSRIPSLAPTPPLLPRPRHESRGKERSLQDLTELCAQHLEWRKIITESGTLWSLIRRSWVGSKRKKTEIINAKSLVPKILNIDAEFLHPIPPEMSPDP
jgi:hypothetical protein